jgi:FlaA1/EpsC-like NDP-sugar epimerase
MVEKLLNTFKNKKILVTGGTGCIGSEIVRSLLKYEPKVVRIFSNDEDATFRMSQELKQRRNIRFLVGDIRDNERLTRAMEDINIVYHTAALKHVPLCEYNPFEAIKTNVLGAQNVINSALENNVDKVINISTDKAVNPTNTMGATKLLAEKLIIDANFYKGNRKTIFLCVRFGNVSFSRGSVIPLFEEQIRDKKMITVTDPEMTRFMMSISNTIDLVFKSTLMAKGGEIFILKMPVVKLSDLADVAIEVYTQKYGYKKEDIKKKNIGPRAGEKMFEELMTETEAKKAFETEDMFIIPTLEKKLMGMELEGLSVDVLDYKNAKKCKHKDYTSSNNDFLSKKEIKRLFF